MIEKPKNFKLHAISVELFINLRRNIRKKEFKRGTRGDK